ncbi:hypothetical protein [Deferrisoma sp.]
MVRHTLFAAAALAGLVAGPALGATNQELERRIDLLSEEIQKLKNELAVSEEAAYESRYGMGPAASKVYGLAKGLSIGGYGEAFYSALVSDREGKHDQADQYRLILYTGYKFTDRIVFNSEIEIEHAKTNKNGYVAVELATLDFLLHPAANLRFGQVLIPLGITNELHEPTLFHGVQRPEVEKVVIPSTWYDVGAGLFGTLAEGLDYKLYFVNGLDAKGFSNVGIKGGRQAGSKAKADDWAAVARLDWEPVLGLTLGASAYLGDAGQNQTFAGEERSVRTRIYEAHGQWKYRGLELKALVSRVSVDDAEALSADKGAEVAEAVTGWYAEAAYDVLPLLWTGTTHYLAPFVRYESIRFDQARGTGVAAGTDQDYDLWVAGVSYKPIPNVVLKAAYRNFRPDDDANQKADEVNLGIGFIF